MSPTNYEVFQCRLHRAAAVIESGNIDVPLRPVGPLLFLDDEGSEIEDDRR